MAWSQRFASSTLALAGDPPGIGLVAGGVGAGGLTRYLRSQLLGLEPTDPATFPTAAAVGRTRRQLTPSPGAARRRRA